MKNIVLAIFFLAHPLAYGYAQPTVVATASMMADMAENIGGNLIHVQTIVPIGGDPHIYEPTPDDARKVEDADLILMNGLTFEGWITELIENSGTKAPSILVTAGITPIQSSQYDNATDPHAWMDPTLGLKYIENIYHALVSLAPEYEEEFTFNYQLYRKQLEDLHIYIQQRISEIPEDQRILITSHDAFQYFGRQYGLRLEAVLGTSTDADVQTTDIRRIESILSEFPVPAVFIESTINPKLVQQLADDNGVVVGGQLYADSLGDEQSAAPTYLDMIKNNTDVIVEALKRTRIKKERKTNSQSNYTWYGLVLLALAVVVFILMRKK